MPTFAFVGKVFVWAMAIFVKNTPLAIARMVRDLFMKY